MVPRSTPSAAILLLSALLLGGLAAPLPASRPNVLIVTVDTLRADRLSGYGYERLTSPAIDRILGEGVRFDQARTVEPLTTPALASMLTGLYPHQHGSTRNGIPMREALPSFPKILERRGYRTAAMVGNWTLKDRLSNLAEHFQDFREVFSRKRWFGLFLREANAEDLTEEAVEWLEDHAGHRPRRPYLLWVHYVEPHAPYRLQREFVGRLGLARKDHLGDEDKYDTEIAFADHQIGRLLEREGEVFGAGETLTVFTADHGESLGEHGYWGHGRHLFEPGLHIPLAVRWPGRIAPGSIDAPALLLDLPRTLLGLLEMPTLETFEGFDWSGVLLRDEAPSEDRVTRYQAHKGSVQGTREDNTRPRERGLLEVALVQQGRKEILRMPSKRWVYDLTSDPHEEENLGRGEEPSRRLLEWLARVREGLAHADAEPPPELREEEVEMLRSLGYLD